MNKAPEVRGGVMDIRVTGGDEPQFSIKVAVLTSEEACRVIDTIIDLTERTFGVDVTIHRGTPDD